jgi:hypothetical protein
MLSSLQVIDSKGETKIVFLLESMTYTYSLERGATLVPRCRPMLRGFSACCGLSQLTWSCLTPIINQEPFRYIIRDTRPGRFGNINA